MKLMFILSLALGLVGCAAKTLRIQSTPPGAEVKLESTKIGVTPLTLPLNKIPKETAKGFLELTLSSPGYQERQVIVAVDGVRDIRLKLEPLDETYFRRTILAHYKKSANVMVREILLIQGYLVSKKNDLAAESLNKFIQTYPNVAAGYVLQSQLELSRGQKAQAIANLERAATLDADDAVVARLLQHLKEKGP